MAIVVITIGYHFICRRVSDKAIFWDFTKEQWESATARLPDDPRCNATESPLQKISMYTPGISGVA